MVHGVLNTLLYKKETNTGVLQSNFSIFFGKQTMTEFFHIKVERQYIISQYQATTLKILIYS